MGGNTKMLNFSFTPIVKTLVTTVGLCAGLFAEYKVVQFAVNKAQLYISEKWFKGEELPGIGEENEGKEEIKVVKTIDTQVFKGGKMLTDVKTVFVNLDNNLNSFIYGDEGAPSNNAADSIAGFITGGTAVYGLVHKTEVVGKVGLGGAHEDSDGSTRN